MSSNGYAGFDPALLLITNFFALARGDDQYAPRQNKDARIDCRSLVTRTGRDPAGNEIPSQPQFVDVVQSSRGSQRGNLDANVQFRSFIGWYPDSYSRPNANHTQFGTDDAT